MGTLFINRGLPGSGKSTRARKLATHAGEMGLSVVVCSSDDYFVCKCCGQYCFDREKLSYAHSWCQKQARVAMENDIDVVIIDNTNCTARECRTYIEFGLIHDYKIEFLEPDTPWAFDLAALHRKNVHNVPMEALERMLRRWVPNMTVEKALGNQQEGEMTADEAAAGGQSLAA